MITELVNNIKDYIVYLKNKGLFISIHTDFAEYMSELLEFNIHNNPVCLLVKSDNEAWEKCIKEHNYEIFKMTESVKQRVCYAGVCEYVFKLNCGGTICVSIKKDSNKNENQIKKDIKTLINPLLRMIEYLKSLCPQVENEVTPNELVNKAIRFIQRNFYNPIANCDIANACSCSESALCHLFKKYKGISVHKYILDLRLSYSKELLANTGLPVTSVAYKAGFADYSYFAYKFKKETGLSASEYREL